MRKVLFLLFLVVSMQNTMVWGEISLTFGEKDDQLGYHDPAKSGPDSEDSPFGPMALRASPGHLWLLDSVKQRILQLTPEGKILGSVPIPVGSGAYFLEDFAIARDGSGEPATFWVVNALSQTLLHIDTAGKLLGTIGKKGKGAGEFSRIARLEIGSSGKVFAADAARKVLVVFSPEGAMLKEVPLPGGGFCLDSKEHIYSLVREKSGSLHVSCRTWEGEPVSQTPIELGKYHNFDVWELLGDDALLLSYYPSSPETDFQKLLRFDLKQKKLDVLGDPPLGSMNRWVTAGSPDKIWVGSFSLSAQSTAPLIIKSLSEK
jgi:hypothetical protein